MTDEHGAPDAIEPIDLSTKKVADLQALAASLGIRGAARLRKSELVRTIEEAQAAASDTTTEASAPETEEAAVDAPADETPIDAAERDAAPASETEVAAAPADEQAPEDQQAPVDEQAAAGEQTPVDAQAGVDEAPADESADPIAAAIFPDTAAPTAAASAATSEGEAPMTLDDLVLPPARGEDTEPARGRRRRRVAVAEGAPESTGADDESDDDGDDDQERGGSRRRGRGRGRRGRNGDDNGTPPGASTDDTADGESGDESDDQGRRGRRVRQQDGGQQGSGQQGGGGQQQGDESDDDRRGRGRYRDRRRGRGDDVDPEISPDDVLLPIAGILDVLDNYAFVRTSGYLPGPNDVYVSLAQVKKYQLRKGDAIVGAVRQPREGEQPHGRQKFNAIVKFDSINGQSPDDAGSRPVFDELTPLYPEERLRLETGEGRITQRMIDLFAPIGKGTRGLIVAPPKSGKSVVLQQIANAIAENSPGTHLMLVLVDERPEEVTSMRRTIRGEVVASTFDLPAEDHTTIADLAIERAKRLVELGHDVVVLLDSITALCRAYNLGAPASGRILAGGVDASALYPPKRFFGAARNVENGGSLTILATAMFETGSRTDEVILEEFAGKGNMELRLSREIADRRIFPALDIQHSGTMQEEQLLSQDEVDATWAIRRELSHGDTQAELEAVLDRLTATATNAEFLQSVRQRPIAASGRAR